MDRREQELITTYAQLSKYSHEALKIAKQILPDSIFIMGGVRQGKSTTFNLIYDSNTIIGAGDAEKEEFQYVLRDKFGHNSAQIKRGYSSVTLIPNITTIGKNISMIDLPGYNENRSLTEVMMINFIIKSCLTYAQSARFIFVISDEEFTSKAGKQFRNLFINFASFIDFFGLTPEQKQSIFKSIAIVLTSVKLDKSYEDKKKIRIQKLRTNLSDIKAMSEQNVEIEHIFPVISEMIQKIINNERLQLFELAKIDQSPEDVHMISLFQQKEWKRTNLRDIHSFIKSSYSQQFNSLNKDDQDKILMFIKKNLQNFEQLGTLMGAILKKFIENPLKRDLDFNQQYAKLKSFLNENQRHGIISVIGSFQQQDEEENLEDCSPFFIRLDCITNFYQQSYIICNDCDRQPEDRKKDYFQYLKEEILEPSLKEIQKYFTTKNKQIIMIKTMMNIFEEGFDVLKFISEIDAGTVRDCHYRLKEAIIFIHKTNLVQNDFFAIFQKKIQEKNVNFDKYSRQQIEEIILFLQKLEQNKNIQQIIYFEQSYKLYKILMKKKEEELEQEDSLNDKSQINMQIIQLFIKTSVNRIFYEFCKRQEEKISQIMKQKDKYQDWQEQLTHKKIWMNLLQLKALPLEQILQLFEEFFSLEEIVNIYNKAIKKKGSKNYSIQIELMEGLANFYHRHGLQGYYYDQLQNIIKKMKNAKDNNKEKLNKLQQKLKVVQSQAHQKDINEKILNKIKILSIDEGLIFISKIWAMVNKDEIFPYKIQLLDEIQKSYCLSIEETKNRNDFFVDLPKNLNCHQILKYSMYLLNKIKDRKAIILIGRNDTGKTTLFYNLCKQKLVAKPINYSYYYDLAQIDGQHNRINHSGVCPTQVPNIHSISEDEILIDTPNLLSASSQDEIIHRYMFTQLLKKCRSIKFILVIHEEDVLKNRCAHLFKWLQLYHSIFNTEDQSLKALAFIFNFVQLQKREQVRNHIKKMKEEFSVKKNMKNTAEKYNLQSHQFNICKTYLDVMLSKCDFFFRASKTSLINNNLNLNFTNWDYLEMSEKKLNGQFKSNCIEFKANMENEMQETLHSKWNFVDQFIQQYIRSLFQALKQPEKQIRKKLFSNIQESLNKMTPNRDLDSQLDKLVRNPTKKEIQFGQILLKKEEFPLQRQIIREYFLRQRMDLNQNKQFNMRSIKLLQNMQQLLDIWNELLCKNEQQFKIFLKLQLLYREYLYDILIITNYLAQIVERGSIISEIHTKLSSIWFTVVSLAQSPNIIYSDCIQKINLTEYDKEKNIDNDAMFFEFIEYGQNLYNQISLADLQKLKFFFKYLEKKIKATDKHQQICKFYINHLKVIDKIFILKQVLANQNEQIRDFDKITIMRELAINLSFLQPHLSLNICDLLKCNTTRLKVHKNIASNQSVSIFLCFEPAKKGIAKDDSYFQLIAYCRGITDDEDIKKQLNKLYKLNAEDNTNIVSAFDRMCNKDFLEECNDLLNQIEIVLRVKPQQ